VLTVASVIEHDIHEKLLALLVDPSVALDRSGRNPAGVCWKKPRRLYQFIHIKVREIIYADTSALRAAGFCIAARRNSAQHLGHTTGRCRSWRILCPGARMDLALISAGARLKPRCGRARWPRPTMPKPRRAF
jgi:hypothetical protein